MTERSDAIFGPRNEDSDHAVRCAEACEANVSEHSLFILKLPEETRAIAGRGEERDREGGKRVGRSEEKEIQNSLWLLLAAEYWRAIDEFWAAPPT